MTDQEQTSEELTPEVKRFMEKKLSSLLGQRAQLDQQITAFQTMLGVSSHPGFSDQSNTPQGSVTPAMFSSALEPDSFFGMKVPQAVLKYFNLVGKPPRPAIDIQKGLEQGGLKISANNAYSLVYNSLLRLEKSQKVVRVNNAWGLKEWYPHIEGTTPPKKEKEEKKPILMKTRKTKAAEAPSGD